jgi:hypothetical protein
MTRLVSSLFAVAFAVSFNACEQHSVAALPPHYQHKMHHGDHADSSHAADKHAGETKDPNQAHKEATSANPAAHPGENPVKKH